MSDTPYCPDCGSLISGEGWSQELCPNCLMRLALVESTGTDSEPEGGETALTEGLDTEVLAKGQILGNRYGIRTMLGRGGMGEVWRAYDLKLRVDVALKTVRSDLVQQERVLQILRQEVLAAREVVSPNVCRVYDLQEFDGREMVSMEYIDGTTLLELLKERGPLELQEAREFASQLLAGLDAIHHAGLVHRDIKPENLMITRTGRVVVMDFGIAKGLAAGQTGTVAGTPAYMSPEQGRGEAVDARADVFSAGIVLAEMLTPDIGSGRKAREALWRGVRQEPPQLPDSPWLRVLETAVAYRREQRYAAASALARALEEVTIRVDGAEDVTPYPGLVAFTAQDKEYFFGRELEAEALWKKIRRLSMLALIGPSGAGKTSFLRAGLLANEPSGWSHVICTPGEAPVTALRQALVPQLSGDSEAMRELVKIEDSEAIISAVSRWRSRSRHALLVVDQFEELFTLNPSEVQTQFAELLGRLVLDADLRVLLSMRDDFLIHCHSHEALSPILSELTLLGPPAGAALRRAVVQPALKCGYRFEDEALVDGMLDEVEGERGALPLVAFAAEQLWQRRDREQGQLTREAYEIIGGVSGALAQHAELTLERIGADRAPIVREVFRNLVTAQSTRAVRDREELLSVFSGDRKTAAQVLDSLIDARLLTSYGVEASEGEGEAQQRIEIVHESLLSAWPRLVRWQSQDVEGARMRDDLRQAARRWQERDRSEDLLWTGSAFREFQVWRERYPGSLSEIEQAFALAMENLATRRRRRRRIVVTVGFVALLAVLAVVSSFWQRSVHETRRAEASKLVALAQVQLEKGATEALAFATASLELADTEEARIFVMKALWHAPPALVLAGAGMSGRKPFFSPDGTWLAAAGHDDEVLVWPENGGEPLRLPGHTVYSKGWSRGGWTAPGLLVTGDNQAVRVWSMPEGRLVRPIDLSPSTWMQVGETHLFVADATVLDGEPGVSKLRRWELPDGQAEDLGSIDLTALGATSSRFDPSGPGWIFAKGDTVYYRPLPLRDDDPGLVIGRHDNDAAVLAPRTGEPDRVCRVWSQDKVTGERRCWSLSTPSLQPLEVIPAPPEAAKRRYAVRSGTGKWLLRGSLGDRAPWLWDLSLLPGGQPLELRANTSWYGSRMDIHPAGKWLVASAENWDQLRFWPLVKTYPSVVEGYSGSQKFVVFSPDGEWLATGWGDSFLRLWPLPTGEPRELQVLEAPRGSDGNLAFDRSGKKVVTARYGNNIFVVSLGGGTPRKLEGFSSDQGVYSTAFSPSGRLVAAGASFGTGKRKVLRVWDLETGDVRVFDLEGPPTELEGITESRAVETGWENVVWTVLFEDESTLLTAGAGGVRRWNLETGTSEVVIRTAPEVVMSATMSDDQTTLFTRAARLNPYGQFEGVRVHHLTAGTSRALDLFGDHVSSFTTDPTGEVLVTGDVEGIVRVGRIDAGEPHLLLGHEQQVDSVAISPDLEWLASAGQDETLRLWPMPDLSKPPLHTLPREELINKLKTLTNLRVVRDEDSPTGWKLEVGPFPGWETVPTW